MVTENSLPSAAVLLLPALPEAEGNVSLTGSLSAGGFSLAQFRANASLEGGRFQGTLEGTTIANVGRLRLDTTGSISPEGNVSLETARLRATVGVPGINLEATGTGTANATGGLDITAGANLRLFGLPSLQFQGTGSVSSTEASLTGTFSGPGPLYTSYITGNFDLSTRRGISLNAGVFGLTYSPGVSVTDPAPPSPGLSVFAGSPASPWTPGGLTLGASFFQYSQGNFNYVSAGFMPDLSERIISNPRFGITAQTHF